MSRRLLLSLLFLLPVQALFAQVKNDEILGKWMSETGSGKIEIFKSADKYYGKIVWLKEPLDKQGQPKTDANNPDPAQRSRKIMGLLILKSFRFDGEQWTDGTIYDPENGKDYQCKMSMNTDGSLNIRGYIGVSLLGRSTVWKRSE